MRNHYHVIENTPGYLPDDNDPGAYSTLTEARGAALELKRQLQDEGYTCDGTMRTGYACTTKDKIYDLGRVINIYTCSDEDCSQD